MAKRSSCLPSLRPSNSRRSVGGICRQKAGERIGSLSAAWAEFACEEQVEAIAGVICAGEQAGLAAAQAAATKRMEQARLRP